MKIATWNVNSIKARKDRALAWLQRHRPDVLCLQELKTTNEAFPATEIEALGYHSAVHGQKTYNGVAVLSTQTPTETTFGMQDGDDDDEARIIRVQIAGTSVISVYVPNGKTVDSDKYAYKLRWLDRLLAYLDRHCNPDGDLCICGDLNIAPEDRDVARPAEWGASVLCTDEVRERFQRLLAWGLTDVFRKHHGDPGHYSWWDYRMLGFPKNNGLRIDHILASAPLAARSIEALIDRDERKGRKPSDHAPVVAVFSDP